MKTLLVELSRPVWFDLELVRWFSGEVSEVNPLNGKL